jgi:hypothetical protein
MVWCGVASAAGSDARRRDEGDVGAHRGGAARLSAEAVALRPAAENFQRAPGPRSGSRTSRPPFAQRTPAADSQTRRPHPFFSCLLTRVTAGFRTRSQTVEPLEDLHPGRLQRLPSERMTRLRKQILDARQRKLERSALARDHRRGRSRSSGWCGVRVAILLPLGSLILLAPAPTPGHTYKLHPEMAQHSRGGVLPFPAGGGCSGFYPAFCLGMKSSITAFRSRKGGSIPCDRTKSLNFCRLNRGPRIRSASARSSIKRW